MAPRQRRRTTDTTESIRDVIGKIFSCGDFTQCEFPLPSEKGAQLSMTGEIIAYGNCGGFDHAALCGVLSEIPTVYAPSAAVLDKYLARMCFTVLCGDCDRSVAMISAIAEIVRSGISKIIIAADTPTERDNIIESLTLMRAGLDGVDITPYRSDDYESFVKYKAAASVYGFLTSENPEILVLSRDSFARSNNIMNRSAEGSDDKSLAEVISGAHACVICSSPTVASGRTLAKISAAFEPCATVIFAGEVKNLRDAVVFRPESVSHHRKNGAVSEFEQIGF